MNNNSKNIVTNFDFNKVNSEDFLMNNNSKNIVINFDFNEVNSAVLRNAQIYLYKKNINNNKIIVITPNKFKYLFSNADYLAVVNPKWVNDMYPTMLEYLGDRQQKYYVESGLEEKCLKKLSEYFSEFEYIRVYVFFDVSTFQASERNTFKWYKLQFNNLKQMILDKSLYMNFSDEESLLTRIQIDGLKKFLQYQGLKIIIRTRNFKNKQVQRNSNFSVLSNLAQEFIKRGIFVLNLGCPLLSLNIENELYFEYDHSMPFEEELALCEHANACIMTAEAGLFTGFAASNINIIQIDEEWSVLNPVVNVNLFETRKKIGIDDIDIRNFLMNNDFLGAVDFVTTNLTSLKRLDKNVFNKQMPDILFL
ncbi:hypothetical protein GM661_06795 [Iocasia frigidifontis]|uniref:Uncharacterized protein n=1 Tax=Iocasia fonsfrigidae TaxID=2682810 RepID=A0A8A7K7F4_9FIRM|nr:hypothetical protein [Iocasia fonsfrigidae]QTL97713.1 hypothetical protein GM661_06795 [Iocasia fonsfrigidae]